MIFDANYKARETDNRDPFGQIIYLEARVETLQRGYQKAVDELALAVNECKWREAVALSQKAELDAAFAKIRELEAIVEGYRDEAWKALQKGFDGAR